MGTTVNQASSFFFDDANIEQNQPKIGIIQLAPLEDVEEIDDDNVAKILKKSQIFASVRDGKKISLMERPLTAEGHNSTKSSFKSTYPVQVTDKKKLKNQRDYTGPVINLLDVQDNFRDRNNKISRGNSHTYLGAVNSKTAPNSNSLQSTIVTVMGDPESTLVSS